MFKYFILFGFILFSQTLLYSQADILRQLQQLEKERRQQELGSDSSARDYYNDPLEKKTDYVPEIDVKSFMSQINRDLAKAKNLFSTKKYEEAVKLYEDVYDKMYEHKLDIQHEFGLSGFKADSLRLPISQCYYKLNELEGSLQSLTDYLSYMTDGNKPIPLEVAQYRAELNYKLQKFQDATYAYTSLINDYKLSDSAQFYAHFYRGISYYSLEFSEYAIQDFNVCVKLQPNRFEPYYNLGRCYFKTLVTKEEIKRAIDYFTKAIERNAVHIPSIFLRARSYERIEKYQAALDDYLRCIALDPTYSDAAYKRAFMKFRLNKSKVRRSICDDFQEAIRLGSGDALLFYNNQCKKVK